jgi:eukaryotic-like serine/threonine-protein kinase
MQIRTSPCCGRSKRSTPSCSSQGPVKICRCPAGTRLGRYEVVGRLGAGGMGEVYRATDPQLGRDVAIKVLPQETVADPQALARFHREARIVAARSHPNLLCVYDFGEHGGLAAAIAEGLAPAHFQGIVHRDLKPENIFLTQFADGSPGRTVILDFGLARWTPAGVQQEETVLTGAGVAMGTVGYMSPEQVRGVAAGAASDIFSLGCVLYEMLAGRPPFQRPTPVEASAAILRDDPAPLPATLPPDLILLATQCLEKSPARRCRSARIFASSLRSILSGKSLSSPAVAPASGPTLEPTSGLTPRPTSSATPTPTQESLIGYRLPQRRDHRKSHQRILPPAGVACGREESCVPLQGQRCRYRDLGSGTRRARVTGRVLQRGETLRVQAELEDVASETQLWGERFQGNLADILAFEEQITSQITAKLRPRLKSGEKPPKHTGDPQAYRFYLQGLHQWHQRTGDSLAKALHYFERAIQADPEYALPYQGLAETLIVLTFFNAGVPKEYLEKAAAAAARAVAIDPEFAPGARRWP